MIGTILSIFILSVAVFIAGICVGESSANKQLREQRELTEYLQAQNTGLQMKLQTIMDEKIKEGKHAIGK